MLLQAGITKGYQEKPCLDPSEQDCPKTAPNKNSGKVRRGLWHMVRSCFGIKNTANQNAGKPFYNISKAKCAL